MFSHENIFHLLFNCMALASFGAAASQQLTLRFKEVEKERGTLSEASPRWHLLSLFISGASQCAPLRTPHALKPRS